MDKQILEAQILYGITVLGYYPLDFSVDDFSYFQKTAKAIKDLKEKNMEIDIVSVMAKTGKQEIKEWFEITQEQDRLGLIQTSEKLIDERIELLKELKAREEIEKTTIFEWDTDLIFQKLSRLQKKGSGRFITGEELKHLIKKFLEEKKQNSILYHLPFLDKKTKGIGNGQYVIVAGRPSVGKCFAKGTEILMYDGNSKKVEDIRVGDLVMGPDSKPRRVIALGRGREEMYRVTSLKTGESYVVNKSHILTLKRSKTDGKYKNGDILNISVKDYINKSKGWKERYKGYRSERIIFKERPDNLLDAYILGVWLGDGDQNRPRFTNTDHEIIDALRRYANKKRLCLSKYKDSYCIYHPKGKGSRRKKTGFTKNSFLFALKKFNLIGNKHIPQFYKINSQRIRLKLLAGLIDTDGYLGKSKCFIFTTKNEVLAKDVMFIARSLGFFSNIRKIEKKCCNNGKIGKYYNVSISGEIWKIPTKVKRKKVNKFILKRNPRHEGITVNYVGIGDYYGFTVDKDGLFLLNNFAVVHNSAFLQFVGLKNAEREKRVVFFSAEMSEELIVERLIKKYSIETLPSTFNVATFSSISSIEAEIEKRKREIDLILIDYIQILVPRKRTKDMYEKITEISSELKKITTKYNLPLVVASQYSRQAEARQPRLSDLRESGALEQDADVVISLWRDKNDEDFNLNNEIKIIRVDLLKNRQGETFVNGEGFNYKVAFNFTNFDFYEIQNV